MASQGWPLLLESTPLASQLAESMDPDSLLERADEEEAAARWGDRVMQDKFLAGDDAGALREKKRNDQSRARARHYRKLAKSIRDRQSGREKWTAKPTRF